MTMLSPLLTQLCLSAVATALALPQSANYDTATSAGGGSAVNSDAGASGSTAGFTLSTGGLVAIIIVVIAAVIFGVVTTVLFVIAKRRQWTMRETMRRASAKIIPRTPGLGRPRTPGAPRTPAATYDRRSKRAGMQMESIPYKSQGQQKRGMMVEVRGGDVEKQQQKDGVMDKLLRNDWKK